MNPTPYLIFPGNCRDAMTAYANTFGAEIAMMMTAAEMPEFEAPEDKSDWIMHSMLQFDGGVLMASDDLMGSGHTMSGCSVMMEMSSNGAAKAAYDALADGGTVVMPYAATLWSEGFGMVTDRFGTSWMISAPDKMP